MGRRIVIVGGGILGSVVASRLLEADDSLQLTLVDASLVAGGASAYSAGVHFPVGRSDRVKALGAAGANYYEALRAREPAMPIHAFPMWVAAPPERETEVRARCVGLEDVEDVDAMGAARPAGLAPDLALWRLPGCHVADVARVTQWHVARLRGRARILEGARVASIEDGPAHATLALSTGGRLEADAVVLAPGPWANAAPFQALTAPLGLRIKKVVALHVDRPVTHGEAMYFPVEDAFLAPLPHRGHWLFSYTCTQWDVSPDELFRANLQAREIDEGGRVLSRVMPDLLPHLGAGRVFCDAYSPEREPVVRRLGSHDHVIFAGAANGSGYRLAPGIALEVAGLLDLPLRQGT